MLILFSLNFIILLIYHAYTDIRYMLLYDKVTLLLIAAGCLRAFYLQQITDALQGAFVLFAIMLALYFVSRGGMGEGDVKLAPALGIWLGVEQGLWCLLFAFVSGGLVGAVLLVCGRSRKYAIPFGPFLCACALIMYFWGERIIDFYWQLML